MTTALLLIATALLVLVNGFFVAAEFALIKVRSSQLEAFAHRDRLFARTALWLAKRLDRTLSACQLGITMASLGLGWIGEPAVARLLEPVFHLVGITSPAVVHTAAFIVAFTAITAVHIVVGEQVPKIFALRRPEPTTLWCAVPLKWFFLAAFPLLTALDATTSFLLRRVGVGGEGGHDMPHSEDEIRALLTLAHAHGELSRTEHRLIDAIFEFDDTVCRQIMVPRMKVAYMDLDLPVSEALALVRQTMHTRYPVCERSMDHVVGFIHVKDLVGVEDQAEVDLRAITRPPKYVPETTPISRLLGHFRASRQHMAFVVDEHGSVVGIVTLENVLERIVGPVQDEFDSETPDVVPDGPGCFIVQGGAQIEAVNKATGAALFGRDVDTIGGLLMERLSRVVVAGDRVELDGVVAEVLEVKQAHATKIRLHVLADDVEGD